LRSLFRRRIAEHIFTAGLPAQAQGQTALQGYVSEKTAGAGTNIYKFETCLSLERLISSHFLFAIS
jgi:hypothetical protein